MENHRDVSTLLVKSVSYSRTGVMKLTLNGMASRRPAANLKPKDNAADPKSERKDDVKNRHSGPPVFSEFDDIKAEGTEGREPAEDASHQETAL
jgi:hypothetical protein